MVLDFYLPVIAKLLEMSLEDDKALFNICSTLIQVTRDWSYGNSIVYEMTQDLFSLDGK